MIIKLFLNLYLEPNTPIPDLKNILQRLFPWLVTDQVLDQINQDSYFMIEECHHDETPIPPCTTLVHHIFYQTHPLPENPP